METCHGFETCEGTREPGQGITGTTLTQIGLGSEQEKPAYVYVSEISHFQNGLAYAFGGGLASLMTGFFGDDWRPPYKQVMGSLETGKSRVLFEMYDKPRSMAKRAHAHTYLSRDLKWAVFNCDRTGKVLLYAARVPDTFLADLLRA